MFFHWSVFLYSLIFFAVVEFFVSDSVAEVINTFSNAHFWQFIFLALVFFVYIFDVAKKVARRKEMTPVPVLLVFATFLLLYFIDTPTQKQIFIVIATLVYYFLHMGLHRLRLYEKDKTAYAMISAAAFATIFIFYAGSFGFYLNFNLSLWILMVIFFLVTALVSYQYFFLIANKGNNALKYALLLGFVMMEIAWAINFWPFGYLTTGVITLIFYYVFWDLLQMHVLGKLTKKRLLSDLIFFSFLIALVLLTSRWVAVV